MVHNERPKNLRTCIYLRKSRKDRDHPEETTEQTLARHEGDLLRFAKRAELDIVEVKKEVVSGDSIAARPKMQELLDEVEDKLYDAVLVIDIDRLGRGDQIDQGIISRAFKSTNTRIITPDKEYNLDDEFDEEFYDISAFFARKELRMIKRRLAKGKTRAVSDGEYIGSRAPYGYMKVVNNRQKTLAPHPEEAPILRLIFDLYVNQNMGDTRIVRHLESHGIPSPSGSGRWDRTVIRTMIRNPVYIGKVAWNRNEHYITEEGTRSSRLRPADQWDLYDGIHPPLISEDLFEKAQRLSDERYVPHLHEKHQLRNPLSYIIKCGACGHTMTLRTSKGKSDTLRCYRHCGGVASSYIHILERALIDQLEVDLQDLRQSFDYVEEAADLESERIALNTSAKAAEKELVKLAEQRTRQFELLEQGIYDNATFLERSRAVAESIQETQRRLDQLCIDLQRCDQHIIERRSSLPRILDAQHFIQNCYWDLDAEHKNEFLRSIIDKVIYFKSPGADQNDFTLDISLKF